MQNNLVMIPCGECGSDSVLVTGRQIYPHREDLYSKKFYQCSNCGAYVGCHPNSIKPLGMPVGPETRKIRMRVHSVLDPIWKSKAMSRNSVYAKLAEVMGIGREKCHIGMFSFGQCQLALTEIMNWQVKH